MQAPTVSGAHTTHVKQKTKKRSASSTISCRFPFPARIATLPRFAYIPPTSHSHPNHTPFIFQPRPSAPHPHLTRISPAFHPHPNRAACAVGGDLPLICAGARRVARRLDGCVGWRALVRLAAATRHGEGAAGTRWQTSARPAERLPHAGLAARAAQAATPSCDASGAGRSPGGA